MDDDLTGWAKQHRTMFRNNTVEVANKVAQIQREVGRLGDLTKLPEPADVWVVAWTILENDWLGSGLFTTRCVAVTQEGRKKPGGALYKIPDACAHFHVACMQVLDVFEAEGWRFELVASPP